MGRPEQPVDPLAGPVERLAWELRRLRDEAGRPSYRLLEQRAHFSRSTLAEAATGTRLPTLEATLAYAVSCGGDRTEWERKWHLAAAELERSQRRCPYPGLLPLDVDAADLFFGRDDLLEVLLKAAQQGPLTVVRGASGSGKSSLLRAGLAARLTAAGTTVKLLTPGAHPLSRLPAADIDGCDVMIVDQFEETFTLCADERERAGFLDALSELVSDQDGPALVIGIRTDFYERCMSHPGLAAVLLDSVHLPVGPMSEQDLRAIITEPAGRAGLSVDPDLVVTVVAEAAEQTGALPMVAHALRETWSRQQGDTLALADYRAAGGVSGAIARTAEHLYADLEADQQQMLRAVLLRLVALGSGSSDTRRGLDRDELAGIGPAGELDAVLDRLAAARLIVVDQDLVDIAHEALLTGWPRLREWLTADREILLRHQRLTSDAAEWDRNGRGEDYLYRGTRLALWDGEASFVPLNESERTFLAACRSSAAERARARRRTRFAFGGLPVAAAAVIVLAALVLVQVGNRTVERRPGRLGTAGRRSAPPAQARPGTGVALGDRGVRGGAHSGGRPRAPPGQCGLPAARLHPGRPAQGHRNGGHSGRPEDRDLGRRVGPGGPGGLEPGRYRAAPGGPCAPGGSNGRHPERCVQRGRATTRHRRLRRRTGAMGPGVKRSARGSGDRRRQRPRRQRQPGRQGGERAQRRRAHLEAGHAPSPSSSVSPAARSGASRSAPAAGCSPPGASDRRCDYGT